MQKMVCPRCECEIGYGVKTCPNCGLSFKYREENTQSNCKRSTASILCYLLGPLGIHSFYLGYFLRGTIRLVLFLLFCGTFVSPQIMQLVSTGNFRITYDYYGIFGLVMLGVTVVSWVVSMVEFVHLILGDTDRDAKGLKLR